MQRVLRTSLLALSLGVLGCEATEPMNNPFQPVHVAPAVAVPGAPGAVEDPRFAGVPVKESYSSEELHAEAARQAGAEPAPEGAASETGSSEAGSSEAGSSVPATSPEGAAPAVAAPEATPAPAPAPAAASLAPLTAGLGWGVRLVSIVPAAQPPRAILGLPDGREVVVTPGAMVPDAGIVVLSVGTRAVQIARVHGVGDHATVESVDLVPQF